MAKKKVTFEVTETITKVYEVELEVPDDVESDDTCTLIGLLDQVDKTTLEVHEEGDVHFEILNSLGNQGDEVILSFEDKTV
jgi:hypothetical protein